MSEVERLRAERDPLEAAFRDICDELGCAYDNEAALIAAHRLRAEVERLRAERDDIFAALVRRHADLAAVQALLDRELATNSERDCPE